MRQTLFALFASASALLTDSAAAIEIVSTVDPAAETAPTLQRLHDFEAGISLTVRTDPARVDDTRLEELIAELDLRDALGNPAGPGRALSRDDGIVLGYSAGSAEIVRTGSGPGGLEIVGLFRDWTGRIVSPPSSHIALSTLEGTPQCFTAAPIVNGTSPVPMLFTLMLDRSGSMDDHIDELRRTAAAFLEDLPDTALCRVISFAGDWSSHARSAAADACDPANFDLSGLRAGGSTDLLPPLLSVYELERIRIIPVHSRMR